MLESKTVMVKWNGFSKKWYENKGYIWTKPGDLFECKVEDLPPSSNVFVEYSCDYCGTVKPIKYNLYNKKLKDSINKKDACINCASKKVRETMIDKYGVEWNTQLNEVKQAVGDKLKIDEDIVNKDFGNKGYIKLTSYIDIFTDIKYICIKHKDKGIQTTNYNNLKHANHTCRYCISENLSGENSYLWKGGITDLNNYLRSKVKQWQFDTLKQYNYTCSVTNIKDRKNVIVHHTYPFYKIVEEVLEKLNLDIRESISFYTDKELSDMSSLCLTLHYKYGYGEVIIDKIHLLYHKFYKNENNNILTFEEFKNRYYNYEFDDLLDDKYKYINIINID